MKSVIFSLSLLLTLVKVNGDGNECWSKVLFGIECCPEGTQPNYFDKYGDWYKKDLNSEQATCGIIDGYCWTLSRDKFVPCCVEEHEPEELRKDGHGDWARENGECAVRHTNRPWNDRELIDETRDEWDYFKDVWEYEKFNFERLSVFVGDDESQINFSWYSKESTIPEVRIGKESDMSDAITYKGTSEEQFEITNIDRIRKTCKPFNITIRGEKYYTNRVTVSNIERNSKYYYQRKLNGKWDEVIEYKTYDDKNFQFIFVGDPQIGGSRGRYRPYPKFLYTTSENEGNRNDAFNWNRVINRAFEFSRNPSVLLSAGDQVDEMGDFKFIDNQEVEYSAFLYPQKLKQIVMATSVGNHEINTNSFGRHFNVPNPLTNSTVTRNYSNWYSGYNYFFKYNNVLVVVLETNGNREIDYRTIVRNAILKYPDTDWRIALFHHDIFGNGFTHSQSDAIRKRAVILNILSKYGFDLVINGHDHVYTTTKFISYENTNKNSTSFYSEKNYKVSSISKNVVHKNPNGTFFITANCSSGSKYMAFYEKNELDYVYDYKQTFTTTFGILGFTQTKGKTRLSITTYDSESYDVVDGSYIFEKDIGSNVDKCWSEKVRGLSCCPPGTKPTNKENGRLYGYHRKDHCGIIDVELLTEDECWAKKYGKDCCILSGTVVKTDNRGQWGEEFGEECGIVKGYTYPKYNEEIPYDTKCWANELGYKCCTDPNPPIYDITEDGEWSYENDELCGIISEDTDEQIPSCWASKLGYDCCNESAVVYDSDEYGEWSIENDEWCGIIKKTTNKIIIPELDPITTTTVPKTTKSFPKTTKSLPKTTESLPTTTKSLPKLTTTVSKSTTTTIKSTSTPKECLAKKLYNEKCCSDPNAEVYYEDEIGTWSVENDDWCSVQLKNTAKECIAEKLYNEKCCSDLNAVVYYEDEIGTWSVENGDWCSVQLNTKKDDCWAKEQGYECCSDPNATVYFTDEGGSWSIENYQWCGIIKKTTNNIIIPELDPITPKSTKTLPKSTTTVSQSTKTLPKSTTTVSKSTTTTIKPTSTSKECLAEKLYNEKCCSDPNAEVYYEDEIGTWSVENSDWCLVQLKNTTKECIAEKLYNEKCCSDLNAVVYYEDEIGTWSVENGDWCSVQLKTKKDDCWAEKQGYECCSDPNATVYFTDEGGSWSIENNQWCGVKTL